MDGTMESVSPSARAVFSRARWRTSSSLRYTLTKDLSFPDPSKRCGRRAACRDTSASSASATVPPPTSMVEASPAYGRSGVGRWIFGIASLLAVRAERLALERTAILGEESARHPARAARFDGHDQVMEKRERMFPVVFRGRGGMVGVRVVDADEAETRLLREPFQPAVVSRVDREAALPLVRPAVRDPLDAANAHFPV